MANISFDILKGLVLTKIDGAEKDSDQISFHVEDGRTFCLDHNQDCCEQVYVEDVIGDVSDLIGNPILEAEEVDNFPEPDIDISADSYTWTFYKIGTIKGHVVIRWLGQSNGYYSERVDFYQVP